MTDTAPRPTESAAMTITRPKALAAIGAMEVFTHWGNFIKRIGANEDIIITCSREHGKGAGRSITTEMRCVAVSVERYNELAATSRRTVPCEDVGSYQARQDISRMSDNVLTSSNQGKPVHYRIMFKRQEAAVRYRNNRRQELKPQPGFPRGYLVSPLWYSLRSGMDYSDLESIALSGTPTPGTA